MYLFEIDVRDGRGIIKVAVANYVDGERLKKVVNDADELYEALGYVKDQLACGQVIDPVEIQAVLDDI
jgi:hypothetical protein